MRARDGIGECFGTFWVTKAVPDYCQASRNVRIALGEAGPVDCEPTYGRQIDSTSKQEILCHSDLGKGSEISASNIEHPVMTSLVSGTCNYSFQITSLYQHAIVALQQVFGSIFGPASFAIFIDPYVQALLVSAQRDIAEILLRSFQQFLVTEDVDLRPDARCPTARPPAKTTCCYRPQFVINLPVRHACEFGQIGSAQAAASGGEQAEQVLLSLAAQQGSFQVTFHVISNHCSVR